MKIFAERLKELRAYKKVSAKTLGSAIGVSDVTIIRWEKNTRNVTGENVVKLAKYFEVPTDYLLGLINEPYW
ncbi:MAG: helix-turn-helix domain-containing protein [Firmicutes bacterium]|nr:helix-turn-helix domain-containing protein [Bacillota bacterium]